MQGRPQLSIETGAWPLNTPHCDSRVLHAPDECKYCAMDKYKPLHEERERLGVNHTGHTDRPWSCPAERARSSDSLNSWPGNRPSRPGDEDA